MKKVYCWLEKMINKKVSFILKIKVEWFDELLKNWIYKFKIILKYNISYLDWIEDYEIINIIDDQFNDKETINFLEKEINRKLMEWKVLELHDIFLYLWK